MNRDGHIIWSEFILICGLSAMLIYFLNQYKLTEVVTGIFLGVGVFLFGAVLPDFDHYKVQEKMHIKWMLGNITKHRGHWHSLVAMCVYGLVIFGVVFPLGIHYWIWIVLAGMFGFFSHLLLDEIQNLRTGGQRAIKLF